MNLSSGEKFTILHTECSRGWGGQEIRVFTEMEAMRQREHRVLLAAPPSSQIYQKCKQEGFEVFSLCDARWLYPLTILKLAYLFKKQKVQVVNTHSSRDGWLGGIAARLAGVPLILRSRHIDVDYPNRWLSRIAYRNLPHHVLTTSQRIAENLSRTLNLDRVTCVSTGIDLQKFHPNTPGRLREELGVSESTKLVGMVSVLRSWKGHEFFLEAAHRILKHRADVLFVIAGEGPIRHDVEQKIQHLGIGKNVALLGHREDVPNILASLDIVVLPSYAHEGIPQILLQALAMKKAVVATCVGGIPEIVINEETGLLVEPRKVGALAEKILILLHDAVRREKFGVRGRQLVEQDHSMEKMCEALERLYERRNPA